MSAWPSVFLGFLAVILLSGCAHKVETVEQYEFRDCENCPQMIPVPTGVFVMGSENGEEGRPEGPIASVRITRAYAMAKTETTLAQFAYFVAESGYEPEKSCRIWQEGEWQQSDQHDWRSPGPGVAYGSEYPVVCVSWQDAIAYAEWLGGRTGVNYRLPSEAEWEYATLAGENGPFAWGEAEDAACMHGNVFDRRGAEEFPFSWQSMDCDDRTASLAPVGSYEANAFGLHDLIGNVWEWTADCYLAPYAMREDRQLAYQNEAGCERRTVRGGSWITRGSRLRPRFRGRDPENARMNYFGFRVARDLDAIR